MTPKMGHYFYLKIVILFAMNPNLYRIHLFFIKYMIKRKKKGSDNKKVVQLKREGA